MQQKLTDTCRLESKMRAKFPVTDRTKPRRAIMETKQMEVMSLISFVPIFLDTQLITKGF